MRAWLQLPGILAWCLVAGHLCAAPLAYESFTYSPTGGPVLGNSGGSGFSSAWKAGGFNAGQNSNYTIQAGSLSFGNLLVTGNSLKSASTSGIAGITRDLTAPLGTPGTTKYISFLVRPDGSLGAGAFNGFFGLVFEQPNEPELFVGKPGADALNRYVLEMRGGALQDASSLVPRVGATALLVVKAEFLAGVDKFTLYTNPTPGLAEPAQGLFKDNFDLPVVNGLTVYSTGAFSLDEIRVGNSFEDVTPVVPEPTSLAMAALGVLGIWVLAKGRSKKACLITPGKCR